MLLSSSPTFVHATPSRTCSTYYSARSHLPINSSPLASPSYSSPTHEAQERRRAQYKSTMSAHRSPAIQTSAKLLFRTGNQTPTDPQKSLLRERFQAQYREHAQKLRGRVVSSRRSSDRSSDVFMDCEDEEESDDVIMQDELFRRIMQNANHKINHSYRVSYALEVGSSFDPDMEDAGVWECELQEQESGSTEVTPDDLEEEELLEYAEQSAALEDSADLDDIDFSTDDWATLSDLDDMDLHHNTPHKPSQLRGTSDMDVS